MTKRAPQFDMPGLRPTIPLPFRPPPDPPRCQAPGCQAWASYGFREPGIAALRKPVTVWVCSAHRNLYP